MIRKIFLSLFLLLATRACLAQTTALVSFAERFPKNERFEGTVLQTQGGVTTRAHLAFQAPDRLRIEIEENAATGIRAQTVVAQGEETRIFDPATKRIQRLPYNVTRQWWRSYDLRMGGLANALLFGLNTDGVNKLYTAQIAANTLTLNAKLDVESRLVNDYVRFGGSGDRIFYAPFKRRALDRPKTILWDAKSATQWMRTSTQDGLTQSATITLAAGLPKEATLRDEKDRVIARETYALTPRATPFPDNTFSFDFTSNQIVEDALLRPMAEYSGADATSKFNLGVAYWKHSEELDLAFATWSDAHQLAPAATAPLLATFEAALNARDTARAAAALDQLSTLLGTESIEVLQRRATLALTRRDWQNAQNTLEIATKAQPQNVQLALMLTSVQRLRGEYSAARDRLLQILANSQIAYSPALLDAASQLSTLSWNDADATLKLLPETNGTLGQRLARAQILILAGKTFEAIETDDPTILAALGTLYEGAGQDAAAITAWQKVVERVPSPADRLARLHLCALLARRGDFGASLAQYREIIAAAPSLQTRNEMQSAFLAAWHKAFRGHQLRAALEQRSLSTGATEDDLRLWLAYQDQFGSAEEIDSAIASGLARFPRSAWWRAQRAEQIMGQVPKTPETAARDRLQRDALDYAEQAVALEPDQTYYAVQRALILTQRATPITAVIDTSRYEPLRKIAYGALEELQKKWPNDPDVQLAIATQRLALEEIDQHASTITLLQDALRGGAPEATDRHYISFAARQVLVTALREAKRDGELLAQYQTLLRASRSADEELGVALNLVRWLMNQKNTNALAQTLTMLARDNWDFEDSQQLLQPLINVVASKAELWPGVLTALRGSNDPYARYLAALLLANRERRERAVLAQPEAPLSAERVLAEAQNALNSALQELEAVATGPDHVLAARASGLLGEQAINREQAAKGEEWIARAAAIEAGAVDLRVALATAQIEQQKSTPALATRDEAVRALPFNFENVRRLAKISDRIGAQGDEMKTMRLATIAMNIGAVTPEVSAGDFQTTALVAARCALYANQPAAGATIYSGLTNTQWSKIDRALVFLDWQQTLRDMERNDQANQIAAQINDLGLSPQELNIAKNNWEMFNTLPN